MATWWVEVWEGDCWRSQTTGEGKKGEREMMSQKLNERFVEGENKENEIVGRTTKKKGSGSRRKENGKRRDHFVNGHRGCERGGGGVGGEVRSSELG